MVREWLATLRDSEDLVNVGAYVGGSNPRIDQALAKRESVASFLRQSSDTATSFEDAVTTLERL